MKPILSLVAGAALLWCSGAQAQTEIAPASMRGCGTISVPTASTVINAASVTLCPNSSQFPTAVIGSAFSIKVQGTSSDGVYICWLGGVCATVAELLGIGEGKTGGIRFLNFTLQPVTAIAKSGTGILYITW